MQWSDVKGSKLRLSDYFVVMKDMLRIEFKYRCRRRVTVRRGTPARQGKRLDQGERALPAPWFLWNRRRRAALKGLEQAAPAGNAVSEFDGAKIEDNA